MAFLKCGAFGLAVVSVLALRCSALNAGESSSRARQEAAADTMANPIRKVVALLQNMQKKIAEEGEKEKKMFEKFMCYCKSSGAGLQESISASDAKIPQVESAVSEAEAQKQQLDSVLKEHKADREAAKANMAEATSIREKEAVAYAKEKSEYDANTQAVVAAIEAIEKGVAGAFLQTASAQKLRTVALESTEAVSDVDRQALIAFLQGTMGQQYAPRSGEIVGILKEIGGEMAKSLSDLNAAEADAKANYEDLMAAKRKEVRALTGFIEEKSVRVGEVAVSIANLKKDLSDTEAALLDDKKFLADLESNCGQKQSQWDEISATRAEELVAVSETIKILQDDDALELFKKTLPSASASFVQLRSSSAELRTRALGMVRSVRKKADPTARQHLDFISLALAGKKIGFEKVITMIDNMVAMLKKEQTDDDAKQAYCTKEFDVADDSKKGFEQVAADAETAIAEAEEGIATLTSELKALGDGIVALDKQVAEATEQRKEEHEDFLSLMADNSAAKDLLHLAKNRLNKFYNPKLFMPPPKRDVDSEASFVQIAMHRQVSDVAPPPPPQAFSAYKSKGQETTGVIAMIDMLVKDLDKEMTEAEANEKSAQAEYEGMLADAADKRAADSASMTAKQGNKADLEGALQLHKDDHTSASKELASVLKYIQSLHVECDWLIQYFDVRKEARASEMDALANAKAVLSGSDFSMFAQIQSRRQLRGAPFAA